MNQTATLKNFYDKKNLLIPVFIKKKLNSNTVYVAGYYLLKYHGMGWQHAFCPKADTYEKYETQGPFLTEWDMNLSLKKARKEQ